MKTDSLFYRLFQQWPELALGLLKLPYSADRYRFVSEEIKQTGFRIDGLFKPADEKDEHLPIIFTEVQYQADNDFYGRFFTEITLYLYRQPVQRPWLALVIYPTRGIEKPATPSFEPFMSLANLQRIYLEDYRQVTDVQDVMQRLLQLLACTPSQIEPVIKHWQQTDWPKDNATLNFVETILVYKMPHLTREEIRTMLGLDTELKQTRFYQEIAEEEHRRGMLEGEIKGKVEGKLEGKLEGRLEGEMIILSHLLNKRFGPLPAEIEGRLLKASTEELERWSDRIFDAKTIDDIFA
jgi:predicted transposase/invertase (TIGR01784 family)